MEAVLLMMAKAKKDAPRKYISLYLTRLRDVRVTVTGEDLKKMGIPPGPRYKDILAGLLDAKLDGAVSTPEDEVAYVKSLVSA
jgi:tRNA nucleotidyltransferase (CCA-adding enzyme)